MAPKVTVDKKSKFGVSYSFARTKACVPVSKILTEVREAVNLKAELSFCVDFFFLFEVVVLVSYDIFEKFRQIF